MKKSLLMLATFSLGTAAIAQMPASPTAPDASTPPMAAPTQTMPMDPGAPSAPATPGAPDAAASMPMPPPAAAAPMASADTASYPVCSKTVKDKCINRSAAPKKMRHKG